MSKIKNRNMLIITDEDAMLLAKGHLASKQKYPIKKNILQFFLNSKEIHNFENKNKDIFSEEEFLYFGIMIRKSIKKANNKRLTSIQFKRYINQETKLLDEKFDNVVEFDGFASYYNNNFIKTIILPII